MREKVKNDMIEKADKNAWITPRGAYAILPCVRKGPEIIIFDKEHDKELGRIACNDMISGDRKEVFSLADYYKEGEIDRIGLQIVTAGMASAVAAKGLKKMAMRNQLFCFTDLQPEQPRILRMLSRK